ncbi:MAG: hypothetical protein WD511_02085 [Balneolaceae bacterium]
MSLLKRATLKKLALVVGVLFYFTACDFPTESEETEDTEDTENYNLYHNLEIVTGAEQTKVTINQGSAVGRDAYFEFEIDNINSNLIAPGVHDGWCIEWTKPIAQQGDTHEDLQMYSTYGKEKYKPLNYFLNIKDQLKAEDSELTFREFQAIIWSVTEGPEFDLNTLSNDELPPRLLKDGEPDFSKEKVNAIVDQVRANAAAFEYNSTTQFALFMQTGDDEQDVMVPSDPPEDPEEETVSHGYVEGITPSDDPQFAERTYPVVQANWEGPGGDKRWLGINLGATEEPSSIDDIRTETNGWYFQFDRLQGHYHDGTTRIPDTSWDETDEGFGDWSIESDPCRELLGGQWRIPTHDEWTAFHESAPLVTVTVPPRYEYPEDVEEDEQPDSTEVDIPDRDHPFESVLSLHWSNYITHGNLIAGGERGSFWTSDEHRGETTAWLIGFSDDYYSASLFSLKSTATTLRCIED